ncbi:MAG TPA: LD-carboxypeptidase [Terriglobales bacterium]|nr:LD-carboxypeptidase [Terriglobales bacterium]
MKRETRNLKRRTPPALQPGDTVGIIAPASGFNRERFLAGCEWLRQMGYRPFYLDSIFDRDLYFAGSVQRRARELEEMFKRDEVRAVLCARGGYGCNYLLEAVDMAKIAAHPKIFVGCSDVTTLLTRFLDAAGLVTFHGPMVEKSFASPDGVDLAAWSAATSSAGPWHIAGDMESLVGGTAEGVLYGGCLSLLVESLGTPYEIRTDGTILFLEDINAKPYQVDRMLMHLKLAGKLEGVHGLIFGEMLDCGQAADQPYTLQEVIKRVVGDLGVPVAFGLRSGHVTRANITLPLGVRAKLIVEETGRLEILEPAVSARTAAAYDSRLATHD